MQPAKTEAQTSASFFPNPFPAAWASDWGEDEFGLWMALTYKGVRQAFRWIVPGTFLMGSPEDESERLDREAQHQLTLTQGYWLADSTCTQAYLTNNRCLERLLISYLSDTPKTDTEVLALVIDSSFRWHGGACTCPQTEFSFLAIPLPFRRLTPRCKQWLGHRSFGKPPASSL